jgi:hypothetical protein
MNIGTKIYTIYGYITITSKKYSAVNNSTVFVGVDDHGNEHEIDPSMVRPAPQQSSSDSLDLAAIGKAFRLKKGDKGDVGPMGPRGLQGFKGDKGDSIKGDKGDTGEKGDKGEAGKDGKDGKRGPRGYDGKKGDSGKDGRDGKDGKNGKDGLNGRDGLNGGGGIHKIDDATDVKISNPTNNQSLTYDAATKKWVNETVSAGGTVGPGTIDELAYFDTATSVASLPVATYPSKTELSYVKGVTSAIQTQLNAMLPIAGGTMTGQLVGRTGSASAGTAPIKLVAGTVNIVPEAGVLEFNGSDLFISI